MKLQTYLYMIQSNWFRDTYVPFNHRTWSEYSIDEMFFQWFTKLGNFTHRNGLLNRKECFPFQTEEHCSYDMPSSTINLKWVTKNLKRLETDDDFLSSKEVSCNTKMKIILNVYFWLSLFTLLTRLRKTILMVFRVRLKFILGKGSFRRFN